MLVVMLFVALDSLHNPAAGTVPIDVPHAPTDAQVLS